MIKRGLQSSLLIHFPSSRQSNIRWMVAVGYRVDICVWLCLFFGLFISLSNFPLEYHSLSLPLCFKQNLLLSLAPWVAHNRSQASQRILLFMHRQELPAQSEIWGALEQLPREGHMGISLIPVGPQWHLGAPGLELFRAILWSSEAKKGSQKLRGRRQSVLMTLSFWILPCLKPPLPLIFFQSRKPINFFFCLSPLWVDYLSLATRNALTHKMTFYKVSSNTVCLWFDDFFLKVWYFWNLWNSITCWIEVKWGNRQSETLGSPLYSTSLLCIR